jgi:D-sedoheptulose 7-phosphate isomerase
MSDMTVPTQQASARVPDLRGYFHNSSRVMAELPYAEIEAVALQLELAYHEGRTVFVFGNGGSAALASHFACDLAKGTAVEDKDHKRFRVLSLTDNMPLLTAWANDSSYEMVFAEQLRNFVQSGDIAFAISGSGSSPNVLRGLEVARRAAAINIGLTGFQGGKMRELCDLCIVIPSDNMQTIEDFHLGVAHALFTVLRHRIAGAGRNQEENPRTASCPFDTLKSEGAVRPGVGAHKQRSEVMDRGR